MVCAISERYGEISEINTIDTTTPEETLKKIVDYFESRKVDALGIGCFGPIDIDRNSSTYGYITKTPKEGWSNVDIVGTFKRALHVPVGFDTDVNAAALGEHTFGIGKGVDNLVYITIGTGIGIGVISEGKLLHGAMHPEGGHILLPNNQEDFKGVCPFHENCFEGLASGPAIEKRYAKRAYDLKENNRVWEIEAGYIAQALLSYTMILSPKRIILGGGVMHQLQLLPLIKEKFIKLNNGYISNRYVDDIDNYIVIQSLEDKQGILGAFELARMEIGYGDRVDKIATIC